VLESDDDRNDKNREKTMGKIEGEIGGVDWGMKYDI